MVIWSDPAKEDLKTIHNYIAHDSLIYAQRVTADIIEETESFSDFPERGRIVPEINDENIREIFIYSYRIIYERSDKDIIIHAVIHSKRDFNKAYRYNKEQS